MEKKLSRFLELFRKYIEICDSQEELSKVEYAEFNELCEEMIKFLIMNPGGLIYIEDKKKLKAYKFAVDLLFKIYSDEDIHDKIFEGESLWESLMFESLDYYSENAKKLKPTFISIKPEQQEFYTFYNESMRCWLYGLTNSSIIIIAALLENLLKDKIKDLSKNEIQRVLKLVSVDNVYNGIEISFENLIDIAEAKGIISKKSRNIAHQLRILRNKIVHSKYVINSDKALILIRETKEIFEELLN